MSVTPVDLVLSTSVGDGVVFLVAQGDEDPSVDLGTALGSARAALLGRPNWEAKRGQQLATWIEGRWVAVRGLGASDELTWPRLAAELAAVADEARKAGCKNPVLVLPAVAGCRGAEAAERIARRLALTGYRFETFKAAPPKPAPILDGVGVVMPTGEDPQAWQEAFSWANRTAAAVAQARSLANTPPNVANPEWLAEHAKTEGRRRHARVRILEGRELEKRGCGGLLAVGGGSATPPRMVVLEWRAPSPRARVALVGKGVTFDTGGYSIKPGQGLEEMKYDKCGACTALAVALAAIDAEIAVDLSLYLPIAENAIDGAAYRPGDIIRHPNGVTTEIHNTDAEGRLILADALCLAAEAKPDYLVELSTLTGACVIALGHTRAGLWTPSDELAVGLDRAATSAGERVWRMPLDPEDREAMDGTHADAKNLGPREGSASSAAQFLGRFVGEVPRWAHLDIAGVAFGGEASKAAGGATGWGVATLLLWLRRVAAETSAAATL